MSELYSKRELLLEGIVNTEAVRTAARNAEKILLSVRDKFLGFTNVSGKDFYDKLLYKIDCLVEMASDEQEDLVAELNREET